MVPMTVVAMVVSAVVALPSLSPKDLRGFPSREEAAHWREEIRKHKGVAETYLFNAPGHPVLILRVQELENRHRAWSVLESCYCQPSDFWTVMELMVLYDVIGKEAYRSKTMPFPFPLHLYEDATGTPFPKSYAFESDPNPPMEKIP